MSIDISIIITQMQMFAFLILAGYIMHKTGLIQERHIDGILAFLTNVIFPSMLITMIPNSGSKAEIIANWKIPVTMVTFFFITLFISFVIARLLHFESRARYRTHVIASCCGNAGFIGAPLCAVVFPELGIPVGFYVMCEAAICWLLGPVLADPQSRFDANNLKRLVNPTTIAILLGFLLAFLDIHPTGFVPWDTVTQIGATTKYFASFYIGINMARTGLRRIFTDARVLITCACKLVLFPLGLYLVISRFGIFSGSLLGFFLIMGGTPTGMSVSIVTELAGGDREYILSATMISTLLCLVTIPLIAQISMML